MDIEDKRELLKDLVKHPGCKIITEMFDTILIKTKEKQLQLDPYKEPNEIMRCKQLSYLIEEELPRLIENIINYDQKAIDKLVAPKRRFNFWKFFNISR